MESNKKQTEILNMETVKTGKGLKYAVVSTLVNLELRGEKWVEVSREPKKIITFPAFDYTSEGHARCKRAFKTLRDRQAVGE